MLKTIPKRNSLLKKRNFQTFKSILTIWIAYSESRKRNSNMKFESKIIVQSSSKNVTN